MQLSQRGTNKAQPNSSAPTKSPIQHTFSPQLHGNRANHKNGKWKNNALERVTNAVTDNGMKLRTVARAFRIPATSFKDHLCETTTSR